ncbi:hypothetical protein Q3G72_024836 [Acer saccharum]|nr:hypothetical protein Q3G72_024836 [Acer saccharum]
MNVTDPSSDFQIQRQLFTEIVDQMGMLNVLKSLSYAFVSMNTVAYQINQACNRQRSRRNLSACLESFDILRTELHCFSLRFSYSLLIFKINIERRKMKSQSDITRISSYCFFKAPLGLIYFPLFAAQLNSSIRPIFSFNNIKSSKENSNICRLSFVLFVNFYFV